IGVLQIGASDEAKEGSWVWVTGEDWAYSNWKPTEPDGGKLQNFLAFWPGETGGRWADITNSADQELLAGFICEWEPAHPKTPGATDFVVQANQEWQDSGV